MSSVFRLFFVNYAEILLVFLAQDTLKQLEI